MSGRVVAIELEACEPDTLPPPTGTLRWWMTEKRSNTTSRCEIVHVQGAREDVLRFVYKNWGDLDSWGQPNGDALLARLFAPVIDTRVRRDFVITPTPEDPSRDPWAIVSAINALDALDLYSVEQGYSTYSGLEEPEGVLGSDKHGLWAVFTNTTLWAIPINPTPARPDEASPEIKRLDHEGVCVLISRNTTTDQLIVIINTEDVEAKDADESGDPYIEVTLNGGTLLDWEQPRPISQREEQRE